MKNTIKKITALLMALLMVLSICACQKKESDVKTYKIGICNFVDDASLNQICDNIQAQLSSLESELNVKFDVKLENCNADSNVLTQIISNFIADNVDLMVGVATPVAMSMQAMTEDNQIPVIFAAVSDPVGAQLVDSLEKPGSNLTGTSDYLDTNAVMNLIFALDPDTDKVGLLFDYGQDSSKTSIAQAKAYLDAKNIEYKEYTGTDVASITQAVEAMVRDGIKVAFTPSDNTVMTAELSIYELMANAGIKHYAGADSFALNGAFVGYGVDYANLGKETANMIKQVLIDGIDPAELGVMTFDNGTATVNTDIVTSMGLDIEVIKAAFEPFCTKVQTIETAESFN